MAQPEGVERAVAFAGAVPLTRQSGLEQAWATSETDGDLFSTYNTALGTIGATSKLDVAYASAPASAVASGIAVFEAQSCNQMHFYFAGKPTTATFLFEIWGWQKVRYTPDGAPQRWMATLLGTGVVTVGDKAVGWLTGGLWAVSLTKTVYLAEAFPSVEIEPGSSQPCALVIDPMGFDKIEFRCSRSGGSNSPTGMQVWVKRT